MTVSFIVVVSKLSVLWCELPCAYEK